MLWCLLQSFHSRAISYPRQNQGAIWGVDVNLFFNENQNGFISTMSSNWCKQLNQLMKVILVTHPFVMYLFDRAVETLRTFSMLSSNKKNVIFCKMLFACFGLCYHRFISWDLCVNWKVNSIWLFCRIFLKIAQNYLKLYNRKCFYSSKRNDSPELIYFWHIYHECIAYYEWLCYCGALARVCWHIKSLCFLAMCSFPMFYIIHWIF